MSHTLLPPLRLGFIGGALNSAVGYTHFNASRMDGHFRVECGCFSRSPQRNDDTARAYGIPDERTHASWQELLSSENGLIDAIVILTPTPDHAELVIAALNAGYAVICEKALAISSAEGQKISEAVERSRGFLAVTYNYSGYPMVRELRHLIEAGHLGKIHQIHIEMPQEGFSREGSTPQSWRLRDYEIPTVSLDLGVHVHHLVHFLTVGKMPLEVIGEQTTSGLFKDVIDNVYGMVHYEDNINTQIWFGKTGLGYRNGLRIRVFGDKAAAEWYQMEPESLWLSQSDGKRQIIDRGGNAEIARQTRYNRFKAGHPSGFIEAFANLYADIAEDLRKFQRGQSVSSTFVYGVEESVQGLRFLEAIARSSRTHAWEKV